MGLATFAIGLLPTYAAVGVLAPILLVTVRIIQGLAFGAEWGGAILMSYEHAPWKKKGRYTGIVQAGFPVGLLIANLVFLFSIHLGGDWAWRVPFLASIVLVIVGLVIRAKVPESPVFEDVKPGRHRQVADRRGDQDGLAKHPARHRSSHRRDGRLRRVHHLHAVLPQGRRAGDQVRDHRRAVRRRGDRHLRHFGWAKLTDKIGRRPLYIWVCALGIPFGVLMFVTVNTGVFILILATFVIAYGVFQNALAGSQGGGSPNCSTPTPAPRERHWPTRSRPSYRVSRPSSPRCYSRATAGWARRCSSAGTWRSVWWPRSHP